MQEKAGTSNKSHEDNVASDLDGQKEHNNTARARYDKNTVRHQTEMKQFKSIVIRDQLKNGMRDFLRMRADNINTASLVKVKLLKMMSSVLKFLVDHRFFDVFLMVGHLISW